MTWQTLDEVAPFLAAVLIICTALWLLGFWRKIPMLQWLAVAAPVLIFGYLGLKFAPEYFDWDRRDFVFYAPGPERGHKGVVQDLAFPVIYASTEQRIELKPRARIGETASGAVELVMSVRDPDGKLLVEDRKVLGSNGDYRWKPMVTNFESTVKGQYQVRIEIPEPVRSVEVRASENP